MNKINLNSEKVCRLKIRNAVEKAQSDMFITSGPPFSQDLEREIQGHQSAIDRVTTEGDRLVSAHHASAKAIRDKNQELQLAWDDLLKKSKNRKKNLDISLQTQKVRPWMN